MMMDQGSAVALVYPQDRAHFAPSSRGWVRERRTSHRNMETCELKMVMMVCYSAMKQEKVMQLLSSAVMINQLVIQIVANDM